MAPFAPFCVPRGCFLCIHKARAPKLKSWEHKLSHFWIILVQLESESKKSSIFSPIIVIFIISLSLQKNNFDRIEKKESEKIIGRKRKFNFRLCDLWIHVLTKVVYSHDFLLMKSVLRTFSRDFLFCSNCALACMAYACVFSYCMQHGTPTQAPAALPTAFNSILLHYN